MIVVNQIRADLDQQRDRFGDCRLGIPAYYFWPASARH